jgi:pimeloyl-ACP methyl ester carboxylesterase
MSETGAVSVARRGADWRVAYLHRPGDGEGESLLYFHGLGGRKEDFRGAWDVGDWDGHALTAFDAPGCGAAGEYREGVPLGVDDIVAAAEALVAHLGLERLTVVGHSLGGTAGLLFTLRHPATVRRFVSVEGNLGPEDCSLYSRGIFQERFLGREETYMEALVAEMRASGAPGLAEAAGELRRNVRDAAFFDYCRSLVGYSDHAPLLEDFAALALPRLYVYGERNAHLTHIPRLESRGVRVRSVPGSDHFPMVSNPGAYYRVLADFILETEA